MRGLFADSPVELEFSYGHNAFRFDSSEHFVSFFETHYGPTLKAREKLTAEGSWDECRTEIVAMAERSNDSPGAGLLLDAEYLVTVARKAG